MIKESVCVFVVCVCLWCLVCCLYAVLSLVAVACLYMTTDSLWVYMVCIWCMWCVCVLFVCSVVDRHSGMSIYSNRERVCGCDDKRQCVCVWRVYVRV